MKKTSTLLLVSALAISMFAEDAAKKSPPATSPAPAATPVIPASAAVLTAPLVLKDGSIGQEDVTDLSSGGTAVFEFTVPKDGVYVIHATVEATGEEANSFYLNIDKKPNEDPLMIWDFDVTSGFQERIVSWRGNGDAENDEFKPKRFTLTAGAHKLHLVGREPARFKSFSVRPAPAEKK